MIQAALPSSKVKLRMPCIVLLDIILMEAQAEEELVAS